MNKKCIRLLVLFGLITMSLVFVLTSTTTKKDLRNDMKSGSISYDIPSLKQNETTAFGFQVKNVGNIDGMIAIISPLVTTEGKEKINESTASMKFILYEDNFTSIDKTEVTKHNTALNEKVEMWQHRDHLTKILSGSLDSFQWMKQPITHGETKRYICWFSSDSETIPLTIELSFSLIWK